MALRRTLFSVLLLICPLALSGCGGPGHAAPSLSADGASAAPTSSPPPAPDPRPTPASSTGPARNLPKPVLPEVAKQNTKEGFEAFTQYWFDVATYSFEMEMSAEVDSISLDDCKVCAAYISDIDELGASDGWASGPSWKISKFNSNMMRDPLGQVVGYFLLDESPSAIFNADGPTRTRKGGNNGTAKAVYASFQDGRWIMRQLGQAS